LRKKNLARPSTIADHRFAEIEYRDIGVINPNTGRADVEVVNVIIRDGQPVEDDDYIFIVKGVGFYAKERNIFLNYQNGRWRVRP
jgi:hypothetical protein